MIHPTLGSSSLGTRNGTRWSLLFYTVTLGLASANFLPMLVKRELATVSMSPTTEFYLSMCYYFSLPLMFEFFLDVAVSLVSSSARKTAEPKLGYFTILVSLFLPIIVVDRVDQDGDTPWKFLSIICFVSFLQTLIVIGQYDKLHFRTKGHWQTSSCILIVFLYVVSQVSFNLAIAYHTCNVFTFTQKLCVGSGIICAICCLVLHCVYSKKYLLGLVWDRYQDVKATRWDVEDYVAIGLQCITFILFLETCFSSLALQGSGEIRSRINSVVINHIILGLCAAIIPGRVMRKNFFILNDKMALKETFIRYVSHEIRSPLSTTSLGLNYLLDRLKANEIKLSEVVEVVQESVVTCELAMNTLNDFLMLDKIESNMVEICTTSRQASEYVLDAVRTFNLQASSSNITLNCNVETTESTKSVDATIEIDSYKMNQVLRNLLSNAFKFTPSGGTVSVTMSIHEHTLKGTKLKKLDQYHDQYGDTNDTTVRVAVKDSGCGISAENLPKLFGQYVQFDAAKLQGGKGSGLGLWLSKAIVEMHGGRIGAESEGEGQGCTFWIELPCRVDADFIFTKGEDTVLSASIGASPKTACPTVSIDEKDKSQYYDVEIGGMVHKTTYTPLEVRDVEESSFRSVNITPKHAANMLTSSGSKRISNGQETPSFRKHSPVPFPDFVRSYDYEDSPVPSASTSPKNVKTSSSSSVTAKRYVSLQEMASRRKQPLQPFSRKSDSGDDGHVPLPMKRQVKALLVDDSAIARKMVERSLMTIGVLCTHAHNGRLAVEKVRQSMSGGDSAVGYDVILIDHYMPEMSGPEAVEVIRNELGYKGVIMGVSGNASTDSDFGTLLAAGKINKVIVKPFNLDAFIDNMNCELKERAT